MLYLTRSGTYINTDFIVRMDLIEGQTSYDDLGVMVYLEKDPHYLVHMTQSSPVCLTLEEVDFLLEKYGLK